MKWKKMAALLLAGIMSLSVFPAYAEAGQYDEAADRLYRLGLLEELPNEAELTQVITRGMAVKYILPFYGVTPGDKGVVTDFSDVEKTNPYSQYVQQAHHLDLIHGFTDNTFRPEEPISYIDALSIFVNALGYKDIVKTYGSYPKGILTIAQAIEITLTASYTDKAAITVGDFLSIMDLAKDADFAEALGGEIKASKDRKDSILTEKHDIYYGEAIMTANEYTALSEDIYLGEGKVMLGNTRFEIGERAGNVGELIGCRVEYYYRDDAAGSVLLWARADKKCDVLVVPSERIVRYQNSQYTYYKNEGSTSLSRADISPDVDVIYNGRVNLHMQAAQWKPLHGEIILVDNNGDKEYDIVKITDFQSMLVGAAFSETRTLRDKYTRADISFEDEGLYEVICIKNGEKISFADIKENNAVNIAASSSDNSKILVTIYVSDEVIEGTVSSYQADGSQADIIVIEGTEYKLSPYAEANANIAMKDSGSFYLDHKGYVVGSVLGFKTGMQYGYFIKALYRDDDEVLSLKVLNTDGRIMYYDIAEKAKTNGNSETTANIMSILKVGVDGTVYAKPVGQPIKYSLNSYGEINKLITHDKTQGGNPAIQDERIRLVNDFTKGVTYYPDKRTVNMACGLTEDAVAFYVPDVASQVAGRASDSDFIVQDITTWKHTNGNRLQTFDDDAMGYCSLVLRVNILGGNTIDVKKDPYAMVDKVTKTLNADDEVISVLHAYVGGKAVQLNIETNTALIGVSSADQLTRGTIIEYNTLENGKVGCINVITTPDNFIPADTYDGNRTRENVTVRGQVQKNNDEVLVISYEKDSAGEYKHTYPAGASKMWFVPVSGGYIHVYDRADDEIRVVSSLSEVKDYEHYGNSASLVMCQMTYMKVSNVFVIN